MITLNQSHLNKLFEFQNNAGRDDFRLVFGNLGNHLWRRFKDGGSNLLHLYSRMDDHNAGRLVAYLNGQGDIP